MERLLQQPMTFLSAIAVVLITTIIVSPKWLHWWSDWKKFQASQQASAPDSGGTETSQTLIQKTVRRPIKTLTFWLSVMDTLCGWAGAMLLVWMSADMSTAPATLSHVAFCASIATFSVVSMLRRW